MTFKLFSEAIIKWVAGIVLVGGLLFLPAGTVFYWNAWLLMGFLFVPMLFFGIFMMIKNPDLLKKRLNTNEKLREQKEVIIGSGLIFFIGFLIAGLNFRFQWLMIPKGVLIVSVIIFLLGYLLYGKVLLENRYLSRVIEVSENQKVIDTGLYGVIRHPMYLATILLFLSMPLILGSIHSFFVFLLYPLLLIKRIKSEEAFLEKHLEGYSEYKKKVKYRLIPLIW